MCKSSAEMRVKMEREVAWNKYNEESVKDVFAFAEDYRQFISKCKTERECVKEAIVMAESAGYRNLSDIIERGKTLKAGDKVYCVNMNKAIVLYCVGKQPIEKGMNILGAHIDSPRIDIKQNPLYEDNELVLLDTHYYGGIKKYQWVAMPMALHGIVALKNGKSVEITMGEKADEPVVGISDLLIHLAGEQMDKKASKVIEGEDLNVLVGSMPEIGVKPKKDEKENVKKYILKLLKKQYGIEEEDFLSAELCVVPAGAARDYGFDKSMIIGYGHDDRVCAYPSLVAQLNTENPEKTTACILVDKEEIGSVGATGMHSKFFENMTAELMNQCNQFSELALRRALANSNMLSSDVNSAFDPNYPSVSEKKNASYFGKGVVLMKYTGARGKSGSNDARAEYRAHLRKILDDAKISYQTAELGKVDVGGGGTIAYILANYGMNVIDSGVGVQNMHAPYEVISKVDLYEALKSYEVFLREA